jgi:hypothetical protein
METMGESTLTAVVAFTTLQLEMGQKMYKVNDQRHEKLERLLKTNVIEETVKELIHFGSPRTPKKRRYLC